MPRMLKDLAKCCRIEGNGDMSIAGVTADSRDVKPGYLFAALPGTRVDGARFIPDAVKAGAAAVLVGAGVELPEMPPSVAVVRSDNAARALALIAARFYVHQPVTIVAVTGTNGKSSVAEFVRQIWAFMGFRAASMGTLGVFGPGLDDLGTTHTTPDAVRLHETLAVMRKRAISHLAMEASSHGLAQHRLDGVRLSAGAFTNLSRDHLDYHSSMEEYFSAKTRLFEELLNPSAGAVVNMDDEYGPKVAEVAERRGLLVLRCGEAGQELRLVERRLDGLGQQLTIAGRKRRYKVFLPLTGGFQAENALVAAGLVIAAGGPEEEAVMALERLTGARGRMEMVGRTKAGAPVFVDYAHTPDALAVALDTLRPYARGRLVVVFGAGGDRDAGKRPLMGQAARERADVVIVTDDNPRSEDAAAIRARIIEACPQAVEIGDRSQAIGEAMSMLEEGDVLLVAGKGHETGQVIGDEVMEFSDHEEISRRLREEIGK